VRPAAFYHRILLALLCLLSLATSASAEGAWLLWHEAVWLNSEAHSLDRYWENPLPYSDRASCMAYLARSVDEWRKSLS
jgi:hypothetical protein